MEKFQQLARYSQWRYGPQGLAGRGGAFTLFREDGLARHRRRYRRMKGHFLFTSCVLSSLLSLILKAGKHTVVVNIANLTGPTVTRR